jgi:hypothetical protein
MVKKILVNFKLKLKLYEKKVKIIKKFLFTYVFLNKFSIQIINYLSKNYFKEDLIYSRY